MLPAKEREAVETGSDGNGVRQIYWSPQRVPGPVPERAAAAGSLSWGLTYCSTPLIAREALRWRMSAWLRQMFEMSNDCLARDRNRALASTRQEARSLLN